MENSVKDYATDTGAAMRLFESATCTTEIEDALDAFELASGPEEVSRLIKHIDAQQAEIQRLNALLDNAGGKRSDD